MARRGRPSASIWDEFTVFEGTERRKYKDATCNHCGKTLNRVQPSRGMINHAIKCPEIPAFLRNQYKETALAKAKKKKRSRSPPVKTAELDQYQRKLQLLRYLKPAHLEPSAFKWLLQSIREMERLVGDPDDGTPVDEPSFLSDGSVFDGAHWGDENGFPRQLDQTPVMVMV